MLSKRKSFYEQQLATPCGELNALWWENLSSTLSLRCIDASNEGVFDLREEISNVKSWADKIAGETGNYPDLAVSDFISRLRKKVLVS